MSGTSFPEPSTPSVRPEGPLELLSRVHSDALQCCSTLRRLVSYLGENGCDDAARRAAGRVLRCFGVSARQDFRDEEDGLFPALLESMAGSDPVCLRELVSTMTQEHRALERMWNPLRASVAEIASGLRARLDAADVEAFVTLYHRHIEREQAELLPMAARLLTDDALEQVWTSMRTRHELD